MKTKQAKKRNYKYDMTARRFFIAWILKDEIWNDLFFFKVLFQAEYKQNKG